VYGAHAALALVRITETHGAEGGFDDVTTHVAKGARAVVPPAAPVEGHQAVDIVFMRSRSQPEVPVQLGGYRRRIGRPGFALRPNGAVGPAPDFVCVADDAGVVPFAHLAYAITRRTLVPHLGDHVVLFGGLRHPADFADVVGHGFLYVHVLAHRHGGQGND